ncbi:MAG: ribonuclease P protein component [Tannerellaceae bacterium]|nr:ribonuclease P protein component [Tannerellaceae bacterium]
MVNKKRPYSFSKEERLSWKRHMDLLFEKGHSFIAFPLRVVYLQVEEPAPEAPVLMMVSVSKKKIKRAVGRNRIRRQVRETYRIRRHELADACGEDKGRRLFVAFIYLDKKIQSFDEIEKAMIKAIRILRNKTV